MAQIGTIIEGKYEILKEVGRGGMSVVYLANDTHLNHNWAVKEVRKRGNGKNDEIVVNSLLAEANMVKRLDHPALPRIVDIIDNGVTIFIVMDFIEGESLDKILKEFGAQSEEQVISWAMQVCDVFSYLHMQKPPIIYRDMKPANLMLKPNGNISIIDFGIAREYKEQNLADTTVLGTKGYAPPEQYSGQTDLRSDIFALGMTMHHLLTGVDPRNGAAYASVRQYVPELSEGIEAIINKCVEPAPENRYQNCDELLLDLQDPSKVTKGWRRKLKRRLNAFIIMAALAVFFALAGVGLNSAAKMMNNQDYDLKVGSSDLQSYYQAIEIYPEKVEAYEKSVEYAKMHDVSNEEIVKIGNQIENHADQLDLNLSEVVELYYDAGKLFFSEYDGALKVRAANAKGFFETAVEGEVEFEKKDIASCYLFICEFMTSQSTTSEHALKDYEELFQKIDDTMEIVDAADDREANYDKISLYYVTTLLINDQVRYMASLGFDQNSAMERLEKAYTKAKAIESTLSYVNDLQEKMESSHDDFVFNVNSTYNEISKRANGGE